MRSKKSEPQTSPHIHFIGIGGIGMSSLAHYYLASGFSVSGSDLLESDIVKALREKGAGVVTGLHVADNIPKMTNRVIISNAIDPENAELRGAERRKFKIQKYSEALGELTKKYTTIAICGSHGKSTTTALAGLVLEKAQLDPTVIVGTKLHEWGGANFRMGKSPLLVIEADEYKEVFLKYNPKIVIATTIDKEHLDHYRTFENVQKAFKKFFARIPKDGLLIANKDDAHIQAIAKELHQKQGIKVIWYSLESAMAETLKPLLKIPGRHNVANALAVVALAKALKIPEETAREVLKNYKGSWRRAEYKGKHFGAHLYDDYAHHPTEINATLAGFREKYPMSRIWCVFQPHQQKRLEILFDDFSKAFTYADQVVLLDAYRVAGRDVVKQAPKARKREDPGEEEPKNSFMLAKAIDERARKPVSYLQYPGELARLLKDQVFEGDVVIMMGAGNINEFTKALIQ